MLIHRFKSFCSISLLAGLGAFYSMQPAVAESPPVPDAVAVAKAYFGAVESSDLDAASSLFTADSSVFESGGVEGTWGHYREHHLEPELDAISAFETVLGEPEVAYSQDASMAFVSWPLEYHIELTDHRTIDSKGTVTFVLVEDGENYSIRHLHWSSRRKN